MPAPPKQDSDPRRQTNVLPVLKAESPWATRIRELLSLHSHEVRYLPYLPLRSRGARGKFADQLANFRKLSAENTRQRPTLPPIGGEDFSD